MVFLLTWEKPLYKSPYILLYRFCTGSDFLVGCLTVNHPCLTAHLHSIWVQCIFMDIILRFLFIGFILYWLSVLALEVSFLVTVVALHILFIDFWLSWFWCISCVEGYAFCFVFFDPMRSAPCMARSVFATLLRLQIVLLSWSMGHNRLVDFVSILQPGHFRIRIIGLHVTWPQFCWNLVKCFFMLVDS